MVAYLGYKRNALKVKTRATPVMELLPEPSRPSIENLPPKFLVTTEVILRL